MTTIVVVPLPVYIIECTINLAPEAGAFMKSSYIVTIGWIVFASQEGVGLKVLEY